MPAPYRLAGRYSEPLLDPFGNGLPGASVAVYAPDTTTPATLYTSASKATTAANPVTSAGTGSTIDALGNLTVFADPGSYDTVTTVGTRVGPTVRIVVPLDPAEAAQVGADGRVLASQSGTDAATTVTGAWDFTADAGLKYKGQPVARVNEGPLSLFDPRVNVLGDGTNEAAKVAAAVTLAGVNGSILIPPGVEVSIAGGQVAPLDGQTLAGAGKGSRLRRFSNGSGDLIRVTSKSRVTLRDFAMTGAATAQATTDYGVRLVGTSDCDVRALYISGQGGDGVGCDTLPNTRPTIQDVLVESVFGHGIQFTGGTVSPKILNNLVRSLAQGYGFIMGYGNSYSSGAIIAGNRARDITGTGGGFQYNWLEDSILHNNLARDCTHSHQFLTLRNMVISLCRGKGGTPTASFVSSLYLAGVERSDFYGVGHDTNSGAANYGARITPATIDCRFYDLAVRRAGSHGIWNEGLRNRFYNPTSELNGGYGMVLWASTDTRGAGGQFEGNASGGMWWANGPNRSRWAGPEVTNYAAAGASPPGINIGAYTADCRIVGADIHDIGAGTPIALDATGTATTKILGLQTDEAMNALLAYRVDGTKVIGPRGAAVADASGGTTVDTEARAAINALLARLRASTGHGLIA